MRLKSPAVKWCLTLMVLMLYAIPWYQSRLSAPETVLLDGRLREPQVSRGKPAEPPFFAVHFVNQARPGVQCHVSSIAPAGENRLICTWYAGSREGARDVAIFAAFFDESRGTWSEPEKLLDRAQSSAELRRWVGKVGNAVVLNDPDGRLWLFYATLLGGWSTASLNYKVSRDGGRTWSLSRRLLLSPFLNLTANIKNAGVPLSGGAYLLPVYHEFIGKFSQVVRFRLDEVDPGFEIRKIAPSRQAIQPALVPRGPRSLAAFFRNAQGAGESYLLRAESLDAGQTWAGLTATTLPNPNSGFAMLPLADGAILGVVNPVFQDRSPLTLVISRDGGLTWTTRRVLEDAPGREYSYPSLTRTASYYHVTYTYERNRIKHVLFNDVWLQESGIDD
ncbi:MAG: sialidase family protein [Desulfobaccales bacterium]